MSYASPHPWATPPMSYATLHPWATPIMSYATPQVACLTALSGEPGDAGGERALLPGQDLATPPQGATPHPTKELRHTHQWATPHPTHELHHQRNELRHTPGSNGLPDCPLRWARQCWWGARPPPWPGPAVGSSPSGSTLCSHQIIIRTGTVRVTKRCQLCFHYIRIRIRVLDIRNLVLPRTKPAHQHEPGPLPRYRILLFPSPPKGHGSWIQICFLTLGIAQFAKLFWFILFHHF